MQSGVEFGRARAVAIVGPGQDPKDKGSNPDHKDHKPNTTHECCICLETLNPVKTVAFSISEPKIEKRVRVYSVGKKSGQVKSERVELRKVQEIQYYCTPCYGQAVASSQYRGGAAHDPLTRATIVNPDRIEDPLLEKCVAGTLKLEDATCDLCDQVFKDPVKLLLGKETSDTQRKEGKVKQAAASCISEGTAGKLSSATITRLIQEYSTPNSRPIPGAKNYCRSCINPFLNAALKKGETPYDPIHFVPILNPYGPPICRFLQDEIAARFPRLVRQSTKKRSNKDLESVQVAFHPDPPEEKVPEAQIRRVVPLQGEEPCITTRGRVALGGLLITATAGLIVAAVTADNKSPDSASPIPTPAPKPTFSGSYTWAPPSYQNPSRVSVLRIDNRDTRSPMNISTIELTTLAHFSSISLLNNPVQCQWQSALHPNSASYNVSITPGGVLLVPPQGSVSFSMTVDTVLGKLGVPIGPFTVRVMTADQSWNSVPISGVSQEGNPVPKYKMMTTIPSTEPEFFAGSDSFATGVYNAIGYGACPVNADGSISPGNTAITNWMFPQVLALQQQHPNAMDSYIVVGGAASAQNFTKIFGNSTREGTLAKYCVALVTENNLNGIVIDNPNFNATHAVRLVNILQQIKSKLPAGRWVAITAPGLQGLINSIPKAVWCQITALIDYLLPVTHQYNRGLPQTTDFAAPLYNDPRSKTSESVTKTLTAYNQSACLRPNQLIPQASTQCPTETVSSFGSTYGVWQPFSSEVPNMDYRCLYTARFVTVSCKLDFTLTNLLCTAPTDPISSYSHQRVCFTQDQNAVIFCPSGALLGDIIQAARTILGVNFGGGFLANYPRDLLAQRLGPSLSLALRDALLNAQTSSAPPGNYTKQGMPQRISVISLEQSGFQGDRVRSILSDYLNDFSDFISSIPSRIYNSILSFETIQDNLYPNKPEFRLELKEAATTALVLGLAVTVSQNLTESHLETCINPTTGQPYSADEIFWQVQRNKTTAVFAVNFTATLRSEVSKATTLGAVASSLMTAGTVPVISHLFVKSGYDRETANRYSTIPATLLSVCTMDPRILIASYALSMTGTKIAKMHSVVATTQWVSHHWPSCLEPSYVASEVYEILACWPRAIKENLDDLGVTETVQSGGRKVFGFAQSVIEKPLQLGLQACHSVASTNVVHCGKIVINGTYSFVANSRAVRYGGILMQGAHFAVDKTIGLPIDAIDAFVCSAGKLCANKTTAIRNAWCSFWSKRGGGSNANLTSEDLALPPLPEENPITLVR